MSSSTTQTTLYRQQLFRQTCQILNSNSLHFILISLLFIPIAISASAAVKFYSSIPSGTDVTIQFDPFNLLLIKTIIASSQNLLTVKTLATLLAFICFVILPTVAGIALITYSAHQGIHRKPLTFSSSLKSLSHSYIHLLHTVIVGSINLIILFLVLTLYPIAITESVKALGFHSDLFLSIFVNQIVSYALAIAIVFFITIWGSAAAITVLESKSGFQPLRQSANQSTEFRRHSFTIVYFTGFIVGTSLAYLPVPQSSEPATNWMVILQAGTVYLQSSLMISFYAVANTVLYVQSKVASGGEVVKTAVEQELSGEYVRLVVDDKDGEVFQESANYTNGGFTYMLCSVGIVLVILGLSKWLGTRDSLATRSEFARKLLADCLLD